LPVGRTLQSRRFGQRQFDVVQTNSSRALLRRHSLKAHSRITDVDIRAGKRRNRVIHPPIATHIWYFVPGQNYLSLFQFLVFKPDSLLFTEFVVIEPSLIEFLERLFRNPRA
jgi:hypothetical protein